VLECESKFSNPGVGEEAAPLNPAKVRGAL